MATIIDKILAEVCLDERITDGVFDMSNNVHMQALFESLMDNFNVNLEDAMSIHNKMIEGKYPERQAYNKDGLLVTFPTPEHKQKAIARGTHFEQDPSKGPTNIYGGGKSPPQPGQPDTPTGPQPNVFGGGPAQAAPAPAPEAPTEPPPPPQGGQSASALPASDSQAPPEAPTEPAPQAAPQAAPAAPQPQLPPSPLPIEPPALPSGNQPPMAPPTFDPPKSPEVRAAEAQAVKKIMGGDPNNPSVSPPLQEQLARIEAYCVNENFKEARNLIHRIKTVGWPYFS